MKYYSGSTDDAPLSQLSPTMDLAFKNSPSEGAGPCGFFCPKMRFIALNATVDPAGCAVRAADVQASPFPLTRAFGAACSCLACVCVCVCVCLDTMAHAGQQQSKH
jgi:hypothetical protein